MLIDDVMMEPETNSRTDDQNPNLQSIFSEWT